MCVSVSMCVCVSVCACLAYVLNYDELLFLLLATSFRRKQKLTVRPIAGYARLDAGELSGHIGDDEGVTCHLLQDPLVLRGHQVGRLLSLLYPPQAAPTLMMSGLPASHVRNCTPQNTAHVTKHDMTPRTSLHTTEHRGSNDNVISNDDIREQ